MPRLHAVLSTGMMQPGMHHGMQHTGRKVLMIKGLVFGIPLEKLDEAFAKAKSIIVQERITTICWDGDKIGYVGPKGEPAPQAFTIVIDRLAKEHPHLEFVYFKKEGKASALVTGVGQVGLDEGAASKGVTQYIGPMPFLTKDNTQIVNAAGAIPPMRHGMNIGIEFSGEMKWYELGLKGLALVKSAFGNDNVSYLVVGLGGAVAKEIEKVNESYQAGEGKYPRGLGRGEVHVVEVVR